MKKIIKTVLIIAISLTFVSCDKEFEDDTYNLNTAQEALALLDWDEYPEDTIQVVEEEAVTLSAFTPYNQTEDVTATLSFSGSAVLGTDFDISGENVISASASGAQIKIPYDEINNYEANEGDFELFVLPNATDSTIVVINITDASTASGKALIVGQQNVRKTLVARLRKKE